MSKKDKAKIQEMITNIKNFGPIPADEVQLNIDVIYNSIIDKICSVVPIDSPNQIVSSLRLKYGSADKDLHNNKDVNNLTLMSNTGAISLDDYGYATNNVKCEVLPIIITNPVEGEGQEATKTATYVCSYKNIIPGTLNIDDTYSDDTLGNVVYKATGLKAGTIDYNKAIITITNYTGDSSASLIRYEFDMLNLMTNRNLAYFEKAFYQMFAELYQLDVDTAVVLNDFKGLNLKDNIDKILPQVLAQQIDGKILSKYFELLDNNLIDSKSWSAKGISFDETSTNSATKHYMDLGTLLSLERGRFSQKTGVLPNIILCDPVAFGVLSVNRHFKAIDNDIISGTLPKYAGKFIDADVFVVQHKTENTDTAEEGSISGSIILTYKGTSDAESSAVLAPYIPVTLRTVNGAEGGGMIATNNIYSMVGFTFTNPELISGIKITDILF